MATTKRLEIHKILTDVLGNNNVYFQPPESMSLKYPCILYFRKSADEPFANNSKYQFWIHYEVILINREPDDGMVQKLALKLPYCRYDRHYVADNLHHDVFEVSIP